MKNKFIYLLLTLSVTFYSLSAHAGIFSFFREKPHNPLVEAVELGNESYVKILLMENGAIINSLDANGDTALIKAAYAGNSRIVEILLKAGADINFKDKNGRTALHWAAKNSHPDVAKILMKYGADATIEDREGNTALKQAIMLGDVAVIREIDPAALKVVETEAVFPAVVAAAGASGGLSTTAVVAAGGAVAAGAGVAVAAGGGGGSSGGGSSGGGSSTPPPSPPPPPPPPPPPAEDDDSATFDATENITLPPAPQNLNRAIFETDEYDAQYGLANSKASYAYARGYTGDGVIVAVVDTGVDLDHSDLQVNIASDGVDFSNDGQLNANDNNGHGTHVAGTIAAVKDDAGMHGVAYNAGILPVKVLTGSGGGFTNDVADGIEYAVDHGAQVINLSLGANIEMNDVKQAVVYAVENNVVVVAAAGNSAASQPINPARYAGDKDVNNSDMTGALIAVGATDINNNLAWFSNKCGDAMNWCMVAPGDGIYATYNDGTYATFSGTSMADPHVSGAAAILLEAFPYLTGRQVASILLSTATDLGAAGIDPIYGHGLLNLEAATRPSGVVVIPLGDSIGGQGIELGNTSVTASSAFGNAFGNSALKLAILDEYGRAYSVNLSDVVQSHNISDDAYNMFEKFTEPGLTQVNIAENMSFGFSNEVREKRSSTEGEESENLTRMSLDSEFDGLSLSFNYNVPVDRAFGARADNYSVLGNIDNPYLGFAELGVSSIAGFRINDSFTVKTGNFQGEQEDTAGKISGMVNEIAYNSVRGRMAVQAGFINEEETLLGSRTEGAFAIKGNTPTWFYGLNSDMALSDKVRLFGSYTYGVSFAEAASSSLFQDIAPIHSESFHIGLSKDEILGKRDMFGIILSQPLRVSSGSASLDLPVARDMAGGILRRSYGMDLAPNGRELDLEAFYSVKMDNRLSLRTGAIYRREPGHIEDAPDDALFVVKLVKGF